MQSAQIKKVVLATSIALLGFTSVAYGANIGAKMESMFHSLSNTTKPGKFETESRGVISGGSLVVRNQISTISLAHLQLPSIDAGCGGIDFFGGSFSYINADQLVEFLKNVASNAIGYAFKMALNHTCGLCTQIMNDLQNLQNAINGMNYNSCELAKGIVTSIDDALFKDKVKKDTEIASAKTGLVEDIAGAFLGTGGKTGSQEAKNDATNTVRNEIDINFAYAAAKKAGSVAMFSDGESERSSLEFLMSLTGTAIQRLPDKDAPDDAMPTFDTYPPTLSFNDFVEGTTDAEGKDSKVRKVVVYQCDTADFCLNPTTVETGSYKGLRRLLVEKLTTAGASTNLPQVYRRGPNLTDEQKALVGLLGSKMVVFIRNLAMVDEGTAIQFIIDTAPIIAGQVAFENGYRIFKETQNSFRALSKDKDPQKAKEVMAASFKQFLDGYESYKRTHGGMDKLLDYYYKLLKTAQATEALVQDTQQGKE